MPYRYLIAALALSAAAWLSAQSPSTTWPNFRGPSLTGSAQATGLPQTWQPTDALWSTKLPGPGSSTPALWGDRLFLTSADAANQVQALCFSTADGKQLWSHPLGPNRRAGHGDMTSPSPVTDGQRIIFMTGDARLLACDFAGQELWQRDLKAELGAISWSFAYGASPLLHDGKLYIQFMRRPTHRSSPGGTFESYLLALDPATGKDLWRHTRPAEAMEESWESYITPVLHSSPSGPQIILAGADAITGHDPATGKELWRCNFNDRRIRNWRLVPTPVSDGQRIYVALPRGVELVALTPPNGTATPAPPAPLAQQTLWKLTTNAPDVCSLLLYENRLFILDGDRKVMTCLDPATGRQLWRGELGGDTVIRSSPTAADGKIYCLDERGQVFVISATGDAFQLLAKIDMAGGQPARSSIIIANNRLYLRTADALHCISSAAHQVP